MAAAKTSGSTCEALQAFEDQKSIVLRAAAELRSDEWSGWSMDEPYGHAPGIFILCDSPRQRGHALNPTGIGA